MTPIRNSPALLKATIAAARVTARVSGRLSGYLAARLWFTPWRLPLGERALAKQERWLQPTSPIELEVEGRRLKGYTGGRGPTVMLVHGWGDSSRSMGAFVAPLIERGFRVVAFDLPAHGDTSGGQTDALQIAAAVRGIAAELGPIHGIVAHSLGAHGTMKALHDGLEVDRVALISPAVLLDSAVEPFVQMFGLPERTVLGLQVEIERRFGATVWTDFAADRLVRDVRVPALVVHDREDPQVPFADVKRLVDAWPSAELEAVSGIGHTRILRDDSVIEGAVAFLENKTSPREAGELVTSDA